MIYLAMKTAHLFALALFAGSLLTVAVLAQHARSGQNAELWRVAFRLNRFVVTPAFIAAFFIGLALAWIGDWYRDAWLIAKFAIVFLLGGIHGSFSGRIRRVATQIARPDTVPAGFFRNVAWLFAFLIAAVVFLAVFKPTF